MNKQTKNIITREWVEKELRFYNSADLKYALVLVCVMSSIFLPIAALAAGELLNDKDLTLAKIILSLIIGTIVSAPSWGTFWMLLLTLKERKKLNRGDFEVVVRELSYKTEQTVNRHIEEYLHFHDFRKISVSHTAYQLAEPNDRYYIVHYKGTPQIKLLYSTKQYEYR